MARTSDLTTHTQQVNHYKTLRISYNAPPAEVKSAYRGLVKEFHPDCNHHLDNHDDIASINLAYEVLSTPKPVLITIAVLALNTILIAHPKESGDRPQSGRPISMRIRKLIVGVNKFMNQLLTC